MDYQFRLEKIDDLTDGPYNTECIACTPPENDMYTLGISKYWKLILHPWQAHIGSCLISLGRHEGNVSFLSDYEQLDFFKILVALETSLKAAFGINAFNIELLMNWAYREKNPEPNFLNGQPNPHIHWHIITRYKNSIKFADTIFTDPNFGEPHGGKRKPKISPQTVDAIYSKLQSKLFL